MNKPQRIKHYPGVILDVVVSSPGASNPTTSPTVHSKLSATCGRSNDLSGTSAERPVDDNTVESLEIIASSDDKQIVRFEQGNSPDSAFEQRLVSFLPPDIQTQVLGTSDVHKWMVQAIPNGQADRLNEQLIACLQYLKGEMSKSNELASRNHGLVSDVKELALKNSELASRNNELAIDIKDLALRNNELGSKNNELASRNNELASTNNELVTDVRDLTLRINELATNNMELTNQVIGLQNTLGAKQDEMKQLQDKALDQLALLQNRVQALVIQTYELHEYPIPRLFVVLPQDTSSWNPQDLFSNKFRLYFLCECGEHTKPTNSKIPHHIHLAKHEGYEINQPTEFFQRYGSYVLTILKMLKLGISVAGVAVPSLSHLLRAEALDQATTGLKLLGGTLQTGLNQAIGCLEKITGDNEKSVDEFSEQTQANEALEGADLRKLESFLNNKDGNKALGNLYRTVTTDGHVKWVCVDHYRENYHEKAAKSFRDTVESLGGSFDENVGRVEINPGSRTQAEQFYRALEKAKSVYELEIGLDWETIYSDFKRLRDTLSISNVGALHIKLGLREGPASDILNRSKRHDPIFDIMRHPSTHSFTITGARGDFVKRSSLLSRNEEFPNLRHLTIGSELQTDLPIIKALVSRTPNLSSLTFQGSIDNCLLTVLFITVAEYQTYPITFPSKSACIPPLRPRSAAALTPQQYLDYLLNVVHVESLDLWGRTREETVLEVLAQLERNSTGLKRLGLQNVSRELGSPFIKKVAKVVSRSELRSLYMDLRREEERALILESIQWKHMRHLDIRMEKESMVTRVMDALVEGRNKEKGQVELDYFKLFSSSTETVSTECTALLRSFVATPIKKLQLRVHMTHSDLESVLNSMDVSRLEEIFLRAKGYSSSQVDNVLNYLTNAHHSLREVHLQWYVPTQQQKKRMQERGVKLPYSLPVFSDLATPYLNPFQE
ncbi:hypothetical protein B0O80DRAFT_260258 [Mortierella sp. GBAus27b]|nr:hypothetical protein B0O80DRAFT_260258 [Mortierella sp. GBAus27b]